MNPKLLTLRRRALAAQLSIAAAGLLCAEGALAAVVSNCNDSGSGSLRAAVAATATGGTVTFSPSLAACTITLSSGEIPISVANLTIQGPASNSFTVSGGGSQRVFHHTGTGTLSLEHLNVEYGKYSAGAGANGGCIASAGSVYLFASSVHNCVATGGTAKARGGAIYATGSATLLLSSVSGNTAQSTAGAAGGGIDAASIDIQYSRITSNSAQYANTSQAANKALFQGGGLNARSGSTSITNSTVSGNIVPVNRNNKITTYANGGCIDGAGSVYIGASTITDCTAFGYFRTQGGAIFAGGNLSVYHSTISNSYSAGTDGAYGGGIRATNATLSYATITGNRVGAGPYGFSGLFEGGGVFLYQGGATISNSTIDSNVSAGGGGGIFTVHSNLTINNSTISSNYAPGDGAIPNGVGGIQMTGTAANLTISNSTIAFNAGNRGTTGTYLTGGVRAFGTTKIESTIIASNFIGGTSQVAADLSCNCGTSSAKTVSGANDLIMAIDPAWIQMPPGMVTVTTDPHLAPLSFHGGETRTHALSANSSAVGQGNNLLGASNDQRGSGYARVVNNLVDIGAYERQVNDDEIFYGGFQ